MTIESPEAVFRLTIELYMRQWVLPRRNTAVNFGLCTLNRILTI